MSGKKLQMLKLNCFYFVVIILLCLNLQACADVAMTGAQALYNRQSIKNNLNDQYITMQAFRAIEVDDKRFKDANISIATFNGEVLLAGQVPHQWQRERIGRIVKQIPAAQRVYNLVTISNPSSTLTRISDSWITAKVKAKLLASGDLDARQIKVVTENSTVFLMGILKPSEADAAIDIARTTDGVTSVVKIFSYIQITKSLNNNPHTIRISI